MSLDYGSMDSSLRNEDVEVDLLHDIGSRPGAAGPVHDVLARLVDFVSALVKCDCCLIYVLEGDEPEVVDGLKLRMGQEITGWVAEHKEPVSVTQNAAQDPRFRLFNELPEDSYEAFLSVPLLSRGNVVGVINLQPSRSSCAYSSANPADRNCGFSSRSGD
jgi:signal transduction protein with GAF and PtsI domain